MTRDEETDESFDVVRAARIAGRKAEPRSIDELNESFPEFRFLEKIGTGSMGAVYRAEDRKLDRTVAVKILHSDVSTERFQREARALARVKHDNIVAVYQTAQSATEPDEQALVMEDVEGVSLRDKLDGGRIAPKEAVRICIPLCEALYALEKADVLHRDIKPSNVLIASDGTPKLVDFGLAKLLGADGGGFATQTGNTPGTYPYMAPECFGEGADHRSDLYSLGAVLYRMISGRAPSAFEDVPPITDFHSQLTKTWKRVVDRCLARDPDRRYQSAAEVRRALTRLRRSMSKRVRRLLLAATTVLAGSAVSLALWARYHVPDSALPPPLARWSFDDPSGPGRDDSDNGHSLVIPGGLDPVPSVLPALGNAAQFRDNARTVELKLADFADPPRGAHIPIDGDLIDLGSKGFSVGFWTKVRQNGCKVCDYWQHRAGGEVFSIGLNTALRLEFAVRHDFTDPKESASVDLSHRAGEWVYVTAVYDRSPPRTLLYIDSELRDIQRLEGRMRPLSHPDRGRDKLFLYASGSWHGSWKSILDELVFYGTDLSKWQVRELYESNLRFSGPRGGTSVSGLVAHFPLDGHAEDESGKGNHGEIHGARKARDRFGRPGRAIEFNGKDEYVEIANDPSIDFEDSFTLAAWVMIKDSARQESQPLISKCLESTRGGDQYSLGFAHEVFSFGSFSGPPAAETVQHAMRGLTAEHWLHVAAVYDHKAASTRLYIDGRLRSEASNVQKPVREDVSLTLGGSPFGTHKRFLEGRLDEVRMYNRALDGDEILAVLRE